MNRKRALATLEKGQLAEAQHIRRKNDGTKRKLSVTKKYLSNGQKDQNGKWIHEKNHKYALYLLQKIYT